MLALTRKKDEALVIDSKIKITVLDIQDGKVKLGIEAPKEVGIYREEVYVEITKSNKESLGSNKMDVKELTDLIKKQKK